MSHLRRDTHFAAYRARSLNFFSSSFGFVRSEAVGIDSPQICNHFFIREIK